MWLLVGLAAVLTSAGCSSSQPIAQETVNAQRAIEEQQSKQNFNRQLTSMAVRSKASDELLQSDYPVGPGDALEISVFDVDELNRTVRVGRTGSIMLPLLGELNVGGRSLRDVEAMIADRLTQYMHDPEVSVYIAEYRSQEVSVTGAVENPAMHALTRPRTVLELLSMSGGLSPEAGNQVYVQTTVDNAPHRFIVNLDDVLADSSSAAGGFQMLLSGGDSIFVPEAGVVFVEGAVERPGSYPLKGRTGVVEAVTMAAGTTFDARESEVQVITYSDDGTRVAVSVPLDKVRANEVPNYYLKNGDIVVVPSNSFKKNMAGFWQGFKGVFGVGYSLSGP